MKTIPLPPQASTLISATRHIGYSTAAAVADLIDNSIAAGAKNVDLIFESGDKPYLAIIDDGCGMDPDELTNAMQYGSSDPNSKRKDNDLGRYGLGLKTASMSQCKVMTVVSKKNGETSARRWDLGFISKHKQEVWPLLILDEDDLSRLPGLSVISPKKTGTAVIWQDIDLGGAFDEVTFDDVMNQVSEHLSLVFHRYLFGEEGLKKLKIKVNGRVLTPKDPFLQYVCEGKQGHQCKPTQPIGSGKDKILLQAFTLPHDKELDDKTKLLLGVGKGLKRTQGFYIYRNKRLITYGNWCGLKAQGEFFKLSRVKVDIPNSLDLKWSLDVKKSVAIPPREILSQLHAYVDSVVSHSLNAIRVQTLGKSVKTNETIQPWNATVRDGNVTSVTINRSHPAVKAILDSGLITERLIQLLERSLPIDVIYYSRSSDQKLENETPFSCDELAGMLKVFLANSPEGIARKNAFMSMLAVEPFTMFANELRTREQEILNETH